MADFYPVLKRAISSLPSGSGESRRIVYEKARAALVKQLQAYDPPLLPAEITDQRLALEECIRRVESEVAGAAFGLAPAESVPVAAPPVAPEPSVEPTQAWVAEAKAAPEQPLAPAPAAAPSTQSAPVAPAPDAQPEVPTRSAPDDTVEARPAPATTVRASMPQPAPRVSVEARVAGAKAPENADPKIGAGISALASTLRQAEMLGGASAQAVRNAREAIADDDDETLVAAPAGQKVEPSFMEAPLGEDLPQEPVRAKPAASPIVQPPKLPRRQHPRIVIERHSPSPVIIGAVVLGLAALVGIGVWGVSERERIAGWFADEPSAETPTIVETAPPPEEPPVVTAEAPADDLEPKILDRLPQEGEPSTPVAPDARQVQTETFGPADTDLPAAPGDEMAAVTEQPATPVEDVPAATAPDVAEAPAATADEPVVLVAQRAILYEEPVPGSEGSRMEGRVLWSFVNEPVLPGEAPVPQIRATVDVPDRGVRLVMSIRENEDEGLPASHIVQLNFELPENFSGRTIDTTPGLILKQTEDARGDPLIGAVAKVLDNMFWLALSGADQDEARNVSLLRERQWIDVPIRYGNRRRAILTFEKGTPGSEVFEQAFQAWAGS